MLNAPLLILKAHYAKPHCLTTLRKNSSKPYLRMQAVAQHTHHVSALLRLLFAVHLRKKLFFQKALAEPPHLIA
jgi:hypothetical protein